MKTVLCLLLLTLSLFTNKAVAHKQLTDSTKNELRKVSNEMLSRHNDNFIIVDAIVAGDIMPGGKASIIYDNEVVTINDRQIQGEQRERYVEKIRKFHSALETLYGKLNEPATTATRFYVSMAKVTLSQIFDTASSFRKSTMPIAASRAEQLRQHNAEKELVKMLATEKLIDTSSDFTVRYNILGLYLNNQKLDAPAAARFVAYINANLLVAKTRSDNLYIDKSQSLIASGDD